MALFVKLVLVTGGACFSSAVLFAPLPSAPVDVKDMVGTVGVIATSSRAGQFSPTPLSEGAERAEAMRVFSGLIALAVSIQHTRHDEPRRGAQPTYPA